MQRENMFLMENNQLIDTKDCLTVPDDLGKLIGDNSFSDLTSDDSSGWMHKIDVTNFQRLTTEQTAVLQTPFLEKDPHQNHFSQQQFQQRFSTVRNIDDSKSDFGYDSVDSLSTTCFAHHDHGHRRKRTVHDFPKRLSSIQKRARRQQTVVVVDEDDDDEEDEDVGNANGEARSYPASQRSSDQTQRLEMLKTEQNQNSSVSSSNNNASGCAKKYPKPVYSFSCLIALALKNSQTGRLQVSEIYSFICENYPYYRTAPQAWKNSVRHNLSLNKCFEKIEIEAPGGHGRKCCLWTINPQKVAKMDQEIQKYRDKDPIGVRESCANQNDLELIEKGLKGMPNSNQMYGTTTVNRNLHDVVQRMQGQSATQAQSYLTVDTTVTAENGDPSAAMASNGPTNPHLALKIFQQAAAGRSPQWLPSVQAALSRPLQDKLGDAESNNRVRSLSSLIAECPLESSPTSRHHLQNQYLSSTPPPMYSTPLRSTTTRLYSPYSQSHQRSSMHQPLLFGHQISPWRTDGGISTQPIHRTPERPTSCCFLLEDSRDHSFLLGSDTPNPYQQRFTGFGTSLEAAFTASSAHNNSLILQSAVMQQYERPPQELQSLSSSPSSHLTRL